MIKTGFLLLAILFSFNAGIDYNLPVYTANRQSLYTIELTGIGEFGLLRKARPGIPAHYHTGIDIKRPSQNYSDEPIFPMAEGVVISKREDGPYAQLIIEHNSDKRIWTVYEHIAGIKVDLYESVGPQTPIARFMNRNELNRYGWQFDHFHFEILKSPPVKLKQNTKNPERQFASYTLVCYTAEDLNKHFYNPLNFFEEQFQY